MIRRRVAAVLAVSVLALAATASQSDSETVPPSVRFTAAGDYSKFANAQAVLSKVGALAPDFHLALGDLSYDTTGSEQAWCDLVTERVGNGFPFELLSGNHEANGQNGNPSCVVDSDADLVRGAGTVFDTVGTGGVQTVPVDSTQPDYPYFAVTNGTGNARTASWRSR